MQTVSTAYKNSMKSPLRERVYIMISFGIINQEIQEKATVNEGDFTYYSNTQNVIGNHEDDTVYATLEENFTKVDGSMFFVPRQSSGISYYDTGIVSNQLITGSTYGSVKISLNTSAIDFKGLSINFGENYPLDFDVVSSTGQLLEVRGNTKSKWSTEEVFENTTSIELVFYAMKNSQNRFRIYSILFGYGLVYYNDSVISSTLDSYISPIGEDVPQIDFSVTLKNYDRYFDVDNPKSAINFLETGQEMDIQYGYQLPNSDSIEWINGNHLVCADWESDDSTATIRCQDIYRNMDSEYYKGRYVSSGKSYYDLAQEVLADAGITDYDIDPRLKTLFTKNPLPRVLHKEALQIIANACRCVLSQSRDGIVQIKSSVGDVTDFEMSRNDMISSPTAIKQELVKEVIVPCYTYQEDSPEENLVGEDITVTTGDTVTYYIGEASYGYRVLFNESDSNVSIIACGSYYITVRFNISGTHRLDIFGHKYKIAERYAIKSLNNRGQSIKWENPLVSEIGMAQDLADWLGAYYSSGVEYEYNTRGNPEIDVTDVIYQENDFRGQMRVQVCQSTLDFNESFSGKITTRRMED